MRIQWWHSARALVSGLQKHFVLLWFRLWVMEPVLDLCMFMSFSKANATI